MSSVERYEQIAEMRKNVLLSAAGQTKSELRD
jgi:hypothetical protein